MKRLKAQIWKIPMTACWFLTAVTYPVLAADAPKIETLQEAKYESTGNSIQQFSTSLALKESDKARPLILTFTNGPEGKQKFQWVRVFLSDRPIAPSKTGQPTQPSGRMIVNENSFGKQDSVDVNLTGFVRGGTTIAVQGAGFKGASLGWKITSPPAGALAVTDVSPKIARGGGTMNITGAGFSANKNDDTVYFEQTKARVTSATTTSIQIEVPTVPTNMRPGEHLLTVVVNGAKAPPFKVTAVGPPEITGIVPMGGPCGTEITINGKNFSEVASENTVYFGKCKGTVSGSTPNSITVTVPQFPELDGFPAYQMPTHIQLTVTVGGAPTKAESSFVSANQVMKE